MKIYGKLFCFIMLTVLIFCNIPTVNAQNADTYYYTDEIDFLASLGIENVSKSVKDNELTRAEAAVYLAQALRYKKEDVTSSNFSDVTSEDPFFGAICYLNEMGVISNSTDNLFRPDDKVTYYEFLKMTVCALGYKDYAITKGGFPTGYILCAQIAKINAKITDDNKFTKGEAFSLIYEMLFGHTLESTGIKKDPKTGENNITYEKNGTLLSKLYDVYEKRGIITANSFISIYNDVAPSQNNVVIDSEIYNTALKISADEVGQNVTYYVNDDNEIIAYKKDESKKYSISSKDINQDTTAKNIVYENNDKITSLKVSDSAYYVYNSIPITGPENKLLCPAYGKLELIDNNMDKVIDIVKIWDYESYYVTNVTSSKILYEAENGEERSINFNDENIKYTLVDSRMKEITLNLMEKNSVITIATSNDKKNVLIMVSLDSFDGVLEEISSDHKAIIDECEYDVIAYADLTDSYNESLTYWTDINETIVKVSKKDDDKYAILYGVSFKKSIDSIITLKFYENGQFKVYECEPKVKYSVGGQMFESLTHEKLYEKLFDSSSGSVPKQLVKYSVNKEKVDKIIIAEKNPVSDNDVFRLNAESELGKTYTTYREYLSEKENASNNYVRWIPRGTNVYIVSDNERTCSYGLANDIFGMTEIMEYTNFKAYDVSEVGIAKCIVIDASLKTLPTVNWEAGTTAYIFDKKIKLNSDGEPQIFYSAYYGVSGNDLKAMRELTSSDEDITNTGREGSISYKEDTVKFNDLKAGDVIQYTLNTLTDEVTGFVLLTRAEDYEKIVAHDKYSTANQINATIGEVVKKDYYGIKVTNDLIDNGMYGKCATITRVSEYPVRNLIAKWSIKQQKFEIADWDDIYIGAKIWNYTYATYSWGMSYFIIIED